MLPNDFSIPWYKMKRHPNRGVTVLSAANKKLLLTVFSFNIFKGKQQVSATIYMSNPKKIMEFSGRSVPNQQTKPTILLPKHL